MDGRRDPSSEPLVGQAFGSRLDNHLSARQSTVGDKKMTSGLQKQSSLQTTDNIVNQSDPNVKRALKQLEKTLGRERLQQMISADRGQHAMKSDALPR
ncbi:MAG: hypothetical protein LBD50_01650 [Rickettsiales bacterium]|nr:hypothetical protein [Rickettsiales bacterium]